MRDQLGVNTNIPYLVRIKELKKLCDTSKIEVDTNSETYKFMKENQVNTILPPVLICPLDQSYKVTGHEEILAIAEELGMIEIWVMSVGISMEPFAKDEPKVVKVPEKIEKIEEIDEPKPVKHVETPTTWATGKDGGDVFKSKGGATRALNALTTRISGKYEIVRLQIDGGFKAGVKLRPGAVIND